MVDKPADWTSHDVVGRVRRLAGTRRVGHAGTLDPMATGVLVLGIERATKLLGHLALTDKSYLATIRLGASTVTDDAEGDVVASASPSSLAAVTDDGLAEAVASLTGSIDQVPSAVSAVKVEGKRAYARVRAGEDVQLAPRSVTVTRFDVVEVRRSDPGEPIDLDVVVECSTGTYVRALARDLGESLGVGGHLTALRRTRVGPFGLDAALTLEQLERSWSFVPVDAVVDLTYPRRELDEEQARSVAHGGRLELSGETGLTGAFAPDGHAVAVMEPRDGWLRTLVVLTPA